MDTRPEQPPEGRLIEDAASRIDISIREAAKRAGISYGRWRQIVKGFQNISPGVFAPVRNAPPRTVARMAAVVGITPEQMETEGQRPDVAAIMREAPARITAPPAPDRAGESFLTGQDMTVQMQPHVAEVEGRLAVWARSAAQQRGESALGEIPDGATVFPDLPDDARAWDALVEQGFLGERFTLRQLTQAIAIKRVRDSERRQKRGDAATG